MALASAAVVTIVVACLLWWTYFGWLKEALEHRYSATPAERWARSTRCLQPGPLPLIGGIVGFAVAIEEIAAHPDEPAPAVVLASLGIGVSLFVAFSALSYRLLGGRILVPRLLILPVMLGALVLVAPMEPCWPLVVVAVALLAIVLIEGAGPAKEAAGSHREVSPGPSPATRTAGTAPAERRDLGDPAVDDAQDVELEGSIRVVARRP